MSRDRVEDFGPYQDAVKLFDLVVEDMSVLQKEPDATALLDSRSQVQILFAQT